MPEGTGSLGLAAAGMSPVAPRPRPRSSRRMFGPVGVSLVLHGAVLSLLLLGLAHQKGLLVPADKPATVELVMTPPGNSNHNAAATAPQQQAAPKQTTAQAAAKPPAPAPKPASRPPSKPTTASAPAAPTAVPPPPTPAPAPPPRLTAEAPLPLPPPAPPMEARVPPPVPQQAKTLASAKPTPTAPPETRSAAPPAPKPAAQPTPHADAALKFNLGGIVSDTNALVTGDMLLPPSADPKYHNPKPNYPIKAAERGEEGSVILMIHVAPDGLVSGVDIAKSSGFRLLDQSARNTVLRWHFLPAVKNGQTVPFTVPLRIVFKLN